jgi:SAM-dependent methyltransferase
MSFREPRAGFFQTTTQLARAFLGGLDNRVDPLRTGEPEPRMDRDAQGNLRHHANTFDHIPPPERRGYRRIVWYLRRALRKFMKPWLRMQTDFNLATQSLLQRLHDDLQSERKARQDAEQRLEHQGLTLQDALRALGSEMEQLRAELEQRRMDVGQLRQELETREREVVHRELGRQGEMARSGAFIQLEPSGPRLVQVTERILENMFVHTRLPQPPARILDLGCREGLSALEMASFGFQVVGVDLRPLPLSHPNFQMVQANLAALPFDDESFDVAVSLSSLEHVGPGWYGVGETGSSDRQVIAEVVRVLRPGGRFILTVPFGRRAVTRARRIYDRAALDELLEPFVVLERSHGIRDGNTWSLTLDEARAARADGTERVSAVCLMVAEKR